MTTPEEKATTARACSPGTSREGLDHRAEALCISIGGLAGAVVDVVSGPLGLNVGAFSGAAVATVAGRALDEIRADEPEPLWGLAALRQDHLAFDALAADILSRVAGGDRDAVALATDSMRARVFAHFEAEEQDLLPAYARIAPDDAAEILGEHASFREAFTRLDIATDLHLVRVDALEKLFASLRAHAAREDAGLHRWAAGR